MNDPMKYLQSALSNPDAYLGTVERNTEIKTVYFALWALGWDPIKDIALGFHIPRGRVGCDAKSANAADFAIRDETGLCAIGEAKHWFIKDKTWETAVAQARRYQSAVGTPRAFLSCGSRWIVFDHTGAIALEIEETNAASLVAQLQPFLGPGTMSGQVTNSAVWDYGIRPSSQRGKVGYHA